MTVYCMVIQGCTTMIYNTWFIGYKELAILLLILMEFNYYLFTLIETETPYILYYITY